jgi:hypothetical protein
VGTRAIKRGKGKQVVDGKDFRLAEEIRYIQDKAADHILRMVTIGQLILFSTQTGDAWLLDVTDKLAARLARDGDPEPIHLEETDTSFAIGWKGNYRIDAPHLSTPIAKLARSPPSSDIPRKRSLKPADLKFQRCLASLCA